MIDASVIGEIGTITGLDHNSQTVNLQHNYNNPVVFAQPLSYSGSDPAIARIEDIKSDRFTVAVQEPNHLDGRHAKESFTYLVLEAGSWQLDNGTRLEVGKLNTDLLGSEDWENVSFSQNFGSDPLVFSQVQTDNGGEFVRTRQRNNNSRGFQVKMEEEEALNNSGHANETLGWLAISAGKGEWNGHRFYGGKTENSVTDKWHTINFEHKFSGSPQFLASIATYDGADPAGLRYQNLKNNQVQVKVEEDTSADGETSHTTEVVNFLAIDGRGLLTGIKEGEKQSPFGGKPWAIKDGARIEAEDFDTGGAGLAYKDTDSSNKGGQYRRSEGVDIAKANDAGGGYTVGWLRNGEFLEYTTNVTGGKYDVKVRVASGNANPGDLRLKLGDKIMGTFDVKNTGGWQKWRTLTLKDVNLAGGNNQNLRLEVVGGNFNVNWLEFDQVAPTQSPFGGKPKVIKDGARIEAEDFDTGGPGLAYKDTDSSNKGGQYRPDEGVDIAKANDTGGGYTVGWLKNGEFLEYTTNVNGGKYDVKVRVASGSSNPGDLRLKLGDKVLGTVDVQNTGGWQNWKTLTLKDVNLPGGNNQNLRLEVVGGSFNVNWFEFGKAAPAQSPFGGKPWAIKDGARIEAEDFDTGGAGLAYKDTDSSNKGGQYRPDQGVDIAKANDAGGGYLVGWLKNGEFLEYTTNVTGGKYDIKVRVATGSANPGDLRLKLGDKVLGTFDVKNTGGWQNWKTLTLKDVNLPGGNNQNLRLEVVGGSFDVNWLEFGKAAPVQEPSEEWDIVYDGLNQSTPLIIKGKKNVLIKNSTFKNIKDSRAIIIRNSDNVQIENVTVDNLSGKSDYLAGIAISNSTNVTVEDSTISRIFAPRHSAGIRVDGKKSANITIDDNHIYNTWGNGILSGGCSGKCAVEQTVHDEPIPGLKITNNLIHDTGKKQPAGASPTHGMYIKAQDAYIANNTVYNAFDGQGISVRSTAVVRGNRIWDTSLEALGLYQMKLAGPSKRSIVEDNELFFTNNKPQGPGWASVLAATWDGKSDKYPLRYDDLTIRNNKIGICSKNLGNNPVIAIYPYDDLTVVGNDFIDTRKKTRFFRYYATPTIRYENQNTNRFNESSCPKHN